MSEQLSYCERWFRAERELIKPLTPDAARTSHDAGELYTVLRGAPERPTAFLEIVGKNGYVGVNFLDAALRVYMIYDFQRRGADPLFLSGVSYWEYIGHTEDVALREDCRFYKDGRASVHRQLISEDAEETGERMVDVSSHFEPWPVFGAYDNLFVLERQDGWRN